MNGVRDPALSRNVSRVSSASSSVNSFKIVYKALIVCSACFLDIYTSFSSSSFLFLHVDTKVFVLRIISDD